MATTATTTEAAKAPKPKTVLEDMPSRQMFATTESAAAALTAAAQTYSDFGAIAQAGKVIAKGVTLDDNGAPVFDSEIYTDQMRVMFAVLTNRVPGGTSKVSAIVITPAPTLDSILASETAKDWLQRIVDKELNHVAVRPLRSPKEGDTLADLAEQMPTTLEAYVTSSRADGGALEVYNELARGVIDAIARKSEPWKKARLTKPELRAAMASRAYAAQWYPTLEDRGEGKESLFVMALNFFKAVATEKGKSVESFDRWLATRNEAKLATGDDEDSEEDDFDISALEFKSGDEAAPAAEVAASDEVTDTTPDDSTENVSDTPTE